MKLNEVFEFVGVFTFDPEFKVENDDCDEFANGFSEDVLVQYPPNKVLILSRCLTMCISIYKHICMFCSAHVGT